MVQWLRKLIGEERGSWVLPLGLGILGFMGQQSAANAQSQAAQAAGAGAEANKEIVDYMLGKARTVYDPIKENVLIPRLQARATSEAPWVPQARAWSQSLGSRMRFPTEDKPALPAPGQTSGGSPSA